ncbi:unnamed protein product [Phyllotreta striolata]|uniref:Protein kinase domain-containing protein n=1 Tax=Phyllotreta striolata TaxID=444603 RepID=A0A9P0GTG8_PHYSR|nr:unnamed protein product [Phyllotreta striolata]
MSREESLWQNELKDLIWLELQAYHADRTPVEEDAYLCMARECVEPLLNDIKNYKFQRPSRRYLTQNSDSGLEEDCPGCVSIYCHPCLEAQNEALGEIERLLKRLEEAERLFPSSKAFAELYPLYRSPEIVGRVRAMCQWYNMTKIQRLKLNILGRLVVLLDSKRSDWPCSSAGDDNGSGSPSDSNNSTNSTFSLISNQDCSNTNDLYQPVSPICDLLAPKSGSNKVSPYRRYIENVLKTRALDKSLNFLSNLHSHVLRKTQITLEYPDDAGVFSRTGCCSDDEELRRYGCWSPEYKTLDLPSYRTLFIFLATVPLEVVHEYLLMRLEQKPTNPSALSIRQLMRELKTGLYKAIQERERACRYIESATSGTNIATVEFREKVEKFDECIRQIFVDFLDYLQQWVLLSKTFQKNLLEEEFEFCMFVCRSFPRFNTIVGAKFAHIMGTILRNTGQRLIERIDDSLETLSANNQADGLVKQNLFTFCRKLQSVFNEERETSLKTMGFVKTNFRSENDLVPDDCKIFVKDSIVAFKCIIPDSIVKVQTLFDHLNDPTLDEADKIALSSRIREILMQIYRFGFEFYKDLSDAASEDRQRCRLVASMIDFADLWMKFATERCERGRGMRPRWAYQGIDFLLTVCEPANTRYLNEGQFEELKKNMDRCISHVIGTTAAATATTPDVGLRTASPRSSLEQMRCRSRGSSPSPRPTYKSQRSGQGRRIGAEQQSPGVDGSDGCGANNSFRREDSKNGQVCIKIEFSQKGHSEKFRDAVEALETDLDDELKRRNLIGRVLEDRTNKNFSIRRNVNFSWQRGIKIGQGRFGKVYTAVNNNTGEMMAVKEIPLQHNDTHTIKRIAEEMKILEGIVDDNLVRSYGVEVHKDEMLIFMEYCSEGTLEHLVAATERGLPELLVRKYAFQLVSGVACLHDHGVVHRDIKTANIFLTDGGNRLKIGDFGCAVRIKSSMTMPGELKGFVGTQAYMAPEVFTKNMSEGHGRAADVWSIGCVVVEMASGQRPWAQYDSNFQIMFKVGMGQSPDPPPDMIDEGLDFLDMCFKHDPKERATARELLAHDFVLLPVNCG